VVASWIEFAFYATAFVLQVYLLGYWFSVTSLVNPIESSRFQIVRFVLSWLVTLAVVFDGVIRVLLTKLSGEVNNSAMDAGQLVQHATLLDVQYTAYSIFAVGMTGAAWLDVSRIYKVLATLGPDATPLTNTMNLACRQLLFTGWMDLIFSLLTWGQVGFGYFNQENTTEWGYLVAATVGLRHFAILAFLGMNIRNLRLSLSQHHDPAFGIPSHLQQEGAFALISDEPSTEEGSTSSQLSSKTPSKSRSAIALPWESW